MTDAEVIARLKEIIRLASELAGADGDHLAVRNRSIEIAACADVMLWGIAPEESSWLDAVYGAGIDAAAIAREQQPSA